MAWMKRISSPKWWKIERKTHKFVTTVRGPHSEALPLQVLVRDVLGFADTGKEAKQVITSGKVLVDGKIRKDVKFGVGAMDVIEMPLLKKAWRAVPKNGLTFVEIDEKEAKQKIVKIIGKTNVRGGKMQINLNDGNNILTDKKYSTKDSLLIEADSHKILDHIEFKEGNLAFVVKGKNDGKMAKIKEIDKANSRVWLGDKERFEVPIANIMMVGKDKPVLKLE